MNHNPSRYAAPMLAGDNTNVANLPHGWQDSAALGVPRVFIRSIFCYFNTMTARSRYLAFMAPPP